MWIFLKALADITSSPQKRSVRCLHYIRVCPWQASVSLKAISSKLPVDVFGHQVNISAYLQEIFQSYREIAIVFPEHTQTPEEMTFGVMYIPFLIFHDTKKNSGYKL